MGRQGELRCDCGGRWAVDKGGRVEIHGGSELSRTAEWGPSHVAAPLVLPKKQIRRHGEQGGRMI